MKRAAIGGRPGSHPSPLMPQTLRHRIEQAIEGLLALLDALDGDADSEPSLGAPEVALPDRLRYVATRFGEGMSQEGWGSGGRADLEDEHDGAEPDVDAEPDHDAENDPSEAGIGDMDGMQEQCGGGEYERDRYTYPGVL